MSAASLSDLLRKPSKYRSKRVTVDGETFDSVAEANRCFNLRTLEKNGLISDLRRQVRYDFIINGVNCGFYKADFVYREAGAEIVEDVKGFATDVFKLKAKLMRACHGITIKETKGRSR